MRIYLLGIAGTGMGSVAGLLRKAGHEVCGSDENVYPPMSDKLAEWGIQTFTPYAAANLTASFGGKGPELCIVGNVLRADNVEARAVRRRGLPHVSFPEALDELFLGQRHPVVVVGTHGKTTTTSLLAAVLHSAGREPSLLVGGVPLDFNEGFRLGSGAHFAIEGDEYDTAYFDKGPKFLHYRPRTAIYTGAEFDHADIYRDLPHYESAFERFMMLLPADGYLAACSSFDNWKRVTAGAKCKLETYSATRPDALWTARGLTLGPEGARFEVLYRSASEGAMLLNAAGRHNVENALGVYAACRALGLSASEIGRGFSSFKGVKRRQELRGMQKGVRVIDDFAHHPTAVRETIAAVAAQHPGQRLIAVFEPRSNTAMRKIHQHEYAHAFAGAAEAIISQPTAIAKVPEADRVDAKKLAADISAAGTPCRWMESPDAIVAALAREAKEGDVVLAMSNGGFGNLHKKLLDALAILSLLALAAAPACASGRSAGGGLPLQTLQGAPFALESARGEVVLLDFWATWCEPCRATLPAAQRVADHLAAKGLRAYVVSVDAKPDGIRAFLDGLHVTLPVLTDPSGVAAEGLGGANLPFVVLLDRKGKLRFKQEGAAEGGEQRLQAEAEKLLAEPATAR